MQFIVKTIKNNEINEIKSELLKTGFDKNYLGSAILKHHFLTLKIQNLPPYVATIIKQTALSKSTDAAVHRNVLTNDIEKSDLIISGSIKQLKEIAKNLYNQPFNLKEIARLIENEINLNCKIKKISIMGILNITPDSFSDGGKYTDFKNATAHANKMINDGADIIDIGAESTRPGAKAVEPGIEIERLKDIVLELKKNGIKISVDTRNHKTAQKMIELGADIINDVSGLEYDSQMIDIIKNSNAQIVVMHSKGTPETMDGLNNYQNMTDEIYNMLYKKIEFLQENGVDTERIIIDTGFGFAKNVEQNFELLKKIKEFNSLGVKHLAGTSRKRFLKSLVNTNDNEFLDEVTMLSSFYLMCEKIDILRVHNVKKTKLALDFYNAIYSQKPCL